jgi:hypothetical protein
VGPRGATNRWARPTRRARYESADAGSPTLAEALTPHLRRWWP